MLLAAGGCASSRPATLLIEHQVRALPASTSEKALSLKLVTYNIWGLPGWMTGARPGRYLPIARELERLDPDIILLQEVWSAKARRSAPTNGTWAIARAAGQHTMFQRTRWVTLAPAASLTDVGGLLPENPPSLRTAMDDQAVSGAGD